MSTNPDQREQDEERSPSAMDGAAGDDHSSDHAEATPASEADPQPN